MDGFWIALVATSTDGYSLTTVTKSVRINSLSKKLQQSEIREIELMIDNIVDQYQIPGSNLANARWIALTASEDLMRILFYQSSEDWMDVMALEGRFDSIHALDEVKYLLRIALLRIDEHKKEGAWTKAYFSEEAPDYSKVAEFIFGAAKFYQKALGIFGWYYSENPAVYGVPRKQMLMVPGTRDLQYRALEPLLNQEMDDQWSPMPILAAAFLGNRNLAKAGGQIIQGLHAKATVNSVKYRNKKLSYPFVAERVRSVYGILYNEPDLVPKEWIFPWGDYEFTSKYFAALQAICFIHSVAIILGSQKFEMTGGGLDQAGLVISRDNLVNRISLVADLEKEGVSRATKLLTYGEGVQSPDLALQPFIHLDEHTIYVAPLHTLSSFWPRNCLSLHARIATKNFDRQSSLFEISMIEKIVRGIEGDFDIFENRTFKVGRRKEELDLLIIQRSTESIFVGECRWSIPPGDPREVFNRRRAHFQKVGQADRKIDFVRTNLQKFLNDFGLPQGDWNVVGCVLCEGYGGHQSPRREIPIIPSKILLAALTEIDDLGLAYEVLCSPLWLPRSGIDIEEVRDIMALDGIELGDVGMAMKSTSYYDTNLNKYLNDAAARSKSDLRRIEW